jgi:thiol-disulfide isomerase/thioredoxin
MKVHLIIFIIAFCWGIPGFSQSQSHVTVVNFNQLEPNLYKQNDTVYFINFWATWCIPCREELPTILKIWDKYSGKKFKMLLVSLDFPNQLENRLIPFINKYQIKPTVLLLDDTDQNRWINNVDPSWEGDIPFTLIYGKGFRQSFAHEFKFNELDSIINNKLNKP